MRFVPALLSAAPAFSIQLSFAARSSTRSPMHAGPRNARPAARGTMGLPVARGGEPTDDPGARAAKRPRRSCGRDRRRGAARCHRRRLDDDRRHYPRALTLPVLSDTDTPNDRVGTPDHDLPAPVSGSPTAHGPAAVSMLAARDGQLTLAGISARPQQMPGSAPRRPCGALPFHVPAGNQLI